MTKSARATLPPEPQPSAPSAPAPNVKRQPAKVRLLIVDSARLPVGLTNALAKLHFECVPVEASFAGVALRRSDVVVFPSNDSLTKVAVALEHRLNPAVAGDRASVVVLDEPLTLSQLPITKFDVDWVEPAGEAASVAKQLANCASEMLVLKGVARRKGSTTMNAVIPSAQSVAPATSLPVAPEPIARAKVEVPVAPEPQPLIQPKVEIQVAPEPIVQPKVEIKVAPKQTDVNPQADVKPQARTKPNTEVKPRADVKPRTLANAQKVASSEKSNAALAQPTSKWDAKPAAALEPRDSVQAPPSEEPTVVGLSLASLMAPAAMPNSKQGVLPPRVERNVVFAPEVRLANVAVTIEQSIEQALEQASAAPRAQASAAPRIQRTEVSGRLAAAPSEGGSKEWETSRVRSMRPPGVTNSIMPKLLPVEGSRWLLLDDDVARAHAVAKSLEAAGAQVVLSGTRPTDAQLRLFRQFGATGVLVEEASLDVVASLLQRFARDLWLRGVNLVTVRWQQLYDAATQSVDVEALKLRVLPHWQPEHDALEALSLGQAVNLAALGPARLLRALLQVRGRRDVAVSCEHSRFNLKLHGGRLWSLEVNGVEKLATAARELESVLRLTEGTVVSTSSQGARRTTPDELELGALLDESWRETPEPGVELEPTLRRSDATPLPAAVVPASPLPAAVEAPAVLSHRQEPVDQPPLGAISVALVADPPLQAATRQARGASASRAALAWMNTWRGHAAGALLLGKASWSALQRRQQYIIAGASLGAVTALASVVIAASRGPATTESSSADLGAPTAQIEPQLAPAVEQPKPRSEEPAARAKDAFPGGCERWLSYPEPKVERDAAQAKSAWHAARRAIQVGDWSAAEESLCRCAALDATGAGPIGLADLYLSRNNLAQASEWAEWALLKLPKDSKVKQMLADVRNQQGRTDEARALLHDSMNLSAEDEQVLAQVAKKYSTAGYKALRAQDPKQARRLFRRASVLDRKNALSRAGLAELALRDGDATTALAWATEAVKLDPRSFEVQLVLGDAHAKGGQLTQAKQAWLEAARISPTSTEPRKRLGL